MKNRLNKFLGFLILSLVILGGFSIANQVYADYATTSELCSTASGSTDYSEPYVDPFTGDVQITYTGSDASGLQLTVQYYHNSSCEWTLDEISAAGVSIEENDVFGLKWISDTEFKLWNFTTGQDLRPDLTGVLPVSTSDYDYGIAFTGAVGITSVFRSPEFLVTRGATISWQEPNFRNDRTTQDFDQFWLCIDIPDSELVTQYDVKVFYGLSEDLPSYANMDQLPFKVPIINNTFQGCILIDKSVDLTPDVYTFTAELYDQNDDLIGGTPPIQMTIITGDKVQVPTGDPNNTETDYKYSSCNNYNPVWFTIVGVRVPNPIEQGCRLFIALFYPDTDFFNTYASELYDVAETKVPVKYLLLTYNSLYDVTLSGSSELFPSHVFEFNSAYGAYGFTFPAFVVEGDVETLFETLKVPIRLLVAIILLTYIYYRALRLFGRGEN